MKAVRRRMKVKSKNMMIQSKKMNLMMMIKKRRSLFILLPPLMIKMMKIWNQTEEKGLDDTDYQFDDDADARLKEPTQTDKEVVQGEGADAKMIDTQQGNTNLETTQEQVVEDAHVTISTVTKKTEVPATSSSLPRTQAPTLVTIPVFVITESSPVYTKIPQSSQTFTPPLILTTPTPPPTIETTNPLSTLPDFASVFRFNERITTLETRSAGLKSRPLKRVLVDKMDKVNQYSGSLSRSRKDKDEDPSAGSDRGLRKNSKKAKAKMQNQPWSKKDSDIAMIRREIWVINGDEQGMRLQTASRRDWFKKPTPPQEPTDPNWNIGKTDDSSSFYLY
ncbi:hypothetical protein Tco_0849254 [Tanacetum coccineum]